MKPGVYDRAALGAAEADFWAASSYTFGTWQFRPVTGEVWKDGKVVLRLTVAEAETLKAIVAVYPLAISRPHILDRMVAMEVYWNPDTVKVIVRKLRAKLGEDLIVTVPQRGYRFNPAAVL